VNLFTCKESKNNAPCAKTNQGQGQLQTRKPLISK